MIYDITVYSAVGHVIMVSRTWNTNMTSVEIQVYGNTFY